jgi:hypothetical protein
MPQKQLGLTALHCTACVTHEKKNICRKYIPQFKFTLKCLEFFASPNYLTVVSYYKQAGMSIFISICKSVLLSKSYRLSIPITFNPLCREVLSIWQQLCFSAFNTRSRFVLQTCLHISHLLGEDSHSNLLTASVNLM